MNYIHYYQSPLGEIILTSDGKSLTGLSYDFPEMLLPYFIEKPLPIFSETDRWLDIYFSGKKPDFTPKLSLIVTGFRKMVWDILLTIPFGQTITYGEIASRIAKQRGIPRMSAQAVGGAVLNAALNDKPQYYKDLSLESNTKRCTVWVQRFHLYTLWLRLNGAFSFYKSCSRT